MLSQESDTPETDARALKSRVIACVADRVGLDVGLDSCRCAASVQLAHRRSSQSNRVMHTPLRLATAVISLPIHSSGMGVLEGCSYM